MARDHRITDNGGNRLPFTCENSRFRTNTDKGFPHYPRADTRGNVIKSALVDYGNYSVWLEHAFDKLEEEEMYWLMWYDEDGVPTIPMSGVFGRDELENMVSRLTRFVP